jgi:hypothetical protein
MASQLAIELELNSAARTADKLVLCWVGRSGSMMVASLVDNSAEWMENKLAAL